MPFKNNICIELSHPEYVPIVKENSIYYGGSQMWFSDKPRYSKDYILHNYGCGTIATADLFLYLALQKKSYRTAVTALAMNEDEIRYTDYLSYLRTIHDKYTKTLPVLAVLGPAIASAINSYSNNFGLGYKAVWKLTLNYYDMYDLIEEMLWKDLPVILSIGPNTPKLWGKKGVPFYELKEIDYQESYETPSVERSELDTQDPEEIPKVISKPYYYQAVKQHVNGHYVTVTALIKDEVTGRIMLRISSWGKQYYINYEEYRDYIESVGGTFTSSIVYVKENY
ncbi:MAG: hypothetical protein K0R46_1197 [Herbinix sp.]|nr:hypothetical protein [Herbinix sp.]